MFLQHLTTHLTSPPLSIIHLSLQNTIHKCLHAVLRREVSGEESGEESGEVFSQHLTIRNARLQRVFAHFGEVLGIFQSKL